jgi:hypothetical protein
MYNTIEEGHRIEILCVVAEARAAEPRGGPARGGTRACQARGNRHLVSNLLNITRTTQRNKT